MANKDLKINLEFRDYLIENCNFKSFSKHDYCGYLGAEGFDKNHPPIINSTEEGTVIFDKNGLVFTDSEGIEYEFTMNKL